MGNWIYFVKTLIKSSLDNYVLPGTLTGSEILWLYMIQWKRDLTTLACATFYLMVSSIEFPKAERVISLLRNATGSPD